MTVAEAEAILGPELATAARAAAPTTPIPPERIEILAALFEPLPVSGVIAA